MATEKKKKSFLKSVANLNTKSSKPQNTQPLDVLQEKPKKSYFLYLIPSLIAVTLLAAIAIPIIISVNRVVRIQPLNPTDPLLELKQKDKSSQTITYEDIEKHGLDNTEKIKEMANNIRSEILYYLYEKEYEASLKLNSIYQAFNAKGSFLRTVKLPTIETIRKSAKEEINQLKTSFQQRFGINNWPAAFADEIANNPRYRGSKSEEEAVEKIVLANLLNVSFSAWDISFNDEFQKVHQDGIQLGHDINYFYQGQEQEIWKTGERASLEFLKHATINSSNGSIATQNPNLVALLSKTSQSKLKDAFFTVLDFLLLKSYKIFWLQDLPLKIERSLNKISFHLSKKDLKNLFQLIPSSIETLPGKELTFSGIKTVFETLFDLPGVQSFSETASTTNTISPSLLQKEITDILNPKSTEPQTQTPTTPKTNGINVTTLETLLANYPHLTPVFFENLYTRQIANPDTPSKIIQRIQELLFPSIFLPLQDTALTRSQLFQLNQKIAEAIDVVQDVDKVINRVFHDFFVTSTPQGEKMFSVFQIKDKDVLFGDSKISILNSLHISCYEKFLNQVIQNFANKNNNNVEFMQQFEELFKSLREEQEILISVLESPMFSNFLQTMPNPLTTPNTYTSQDINSVLAFWKNTLNEEKEKTFFKVFEEFQKSVTNPSFFTTTLDFSLQNSKLYFSNFLSPQKVHIPAIVTFLQAFNQEMGFIKDRDIIEVNYAKTE